ncbi:MAG: FAD-dependent oxidoreductase [Candidatus Dormibacteraeota bacterium]|nr:FAD-dependent oxidoreductase [Candidatus Dormibacteraeota bacterium]
MKARRITVYGAPWCPDCRRSKKFLAEQRVTYSWVDIDADKDGLRHVEERQHGGRTIPMIEIDDDVLLIDPPDEELARTLGLTLEPQCRSYDLAIVGGGPAGLAAAIYAAREGIDAIVVERSGLGGQAGVTERIENYPGFPDGVGGGELADRMIQQARRYGVELLSAVGVTALTPGDDGDVAVSLGTDNEITAHSALIATGSTYRRLGVPGEDDLIGAGIHFCATCDGPFYRGADELMVIGGGNSALEEGLFLSRFAGHISVVQRGGALTASRLVQDRVAADPRFSVLLNTDVVAFEGNGKLKAVRVRDATTGAERELHPAAAFVFIGLDPNTAFLRGAVELDSHGFVVEDGSFRTSMPGVFVAGDVRRGSTKQLGSAVGDGIAALLAIRRHLEAHHHLAPRAED